MPCVLQRVCPQQWALLFWPWTRPLLGCWVTCWPILAVHTTDHSTCAQARCSAPVLSWMCTNLKCDRTHLCTARPTAERCVSFHFLTRASEGSLPAPLRVSA